jgi:hypothetical protein
MLGVEYSDPKVLLTPFVFEGGLSLGIVLSSGSY